MKFQFAAIALTITGAVSTGAMAVGTEAGQQNAAKQEKERHCIVDTIAVREGESLPKNVAAAEPRCFQSFSEAIFAATGGAVSVSPDMRPEDFNEQALPDIHQPAASYVIGIEYEHRDYGGSSLVYWSGNSCIGYWHSVAYVGDNWNDQISSARAFSECNNSVHYEHRDFQGATVNCYRDCYYVGEAMNDRTSSIIWSR